MVSECGFHDRFGLPRGLVRWLLAICFSWTGAELSYADETTDDEFINSVEDWENLSGNGIKVTSADIKRTREGDNDVTYALVWDPNRVFLCFVSTTRLGAGAGRDETDKESPAGVRSCAGARISCQPLRFRPGMRRGKLRFVSRGFACGILPVGSK